METELQGRCQTAVWTLNNLRAKLEVMEKRRDDAQLQTEGLSQLNGLLREGRALEAALEAPHSMPSSRRDFWRQQIKSLVSECLNLQFSLGTFYEKQGLRQRQNEERRQLLEGGDQETCLELGGMLQDAAGLDRANAAADGILDMAQAALAELGEQTEQLRGIHRRLVGLGVSAQLSRTLLRAIERRQITDKHILFGGMIFVVVFLLVMWWYIR